MTPIEFYDVEERRSLFTLYSADVIPRIGEIVVLGPRHYNVLDVKYNYNQHAAPDNTALKSVQISLRDKVYDSYIGG